MKKIISKRNIIRILIGLVVVFIAIQFISVDRTNPPVTGEMKLPPEIKTVMQRSCYDCHSNETIWPWYSKVAPVSWLVSKDVVEGREELNFSEWDKYTLKKREKKIREIWKEIEEGEMPMFIFTLTHSNAILSDKDKELIKNWVNNYNASKDSVSIPTSKPD